MMEKYCIPAWPIPDHIVCFTTKRFGGNSQGHFDSYNLAQHVNDNHQHVRQNRLLLKQDWQISQDIRWLNQIHGSRVTQWDNNEPCVNADAVITEEQQQPCALLTADCLPILLCNQDGTEISAIHAGWRGLRDGIIGNTVHKMKSNKKELLAWIGPGLSPQGFEVSKDIKQQFLMIDRDYYRAFESVNKHTYGNLQLLARMQLLQHGVEQVHESEQYTDLQPNDYFSYRQNKVTGRMATLIMIKGL